MPVILANLGLILGGLVILILIVVIATGYVKARQTPHSSFQVFVKRPSSVSHLSKFHSLKDWIS